MTCQPARSLLSALHGGAPRPAHRASPERGRVSSEQLSRLLEPTRVGRAAIAGSWSISSAFRRCSPTRRRSASAAAVPTISSDAGPRSRSPPGSLRDAAETREHAVRAPGCRRCPPRHGRKPARPCEGDRPRATLPAGETGWHTAPASVPCPRVGRRREGVPPPYPLDAVTAIWAGLARTRTASAGPPPRCSSRSSAWAAASTSAACAACPERAAW